MRKKLIIALALYFVLMAAFYFMAAFINVNINPVRWGDFGRTIYIVLGNFLSVFASLVYYFKDDD